MLRGTVRLAFALFLLADLARPLAELLCSRLVLVRHLPDLGLAVVLVMTVHFGYVWAYRVTSCEKLDWLTRILLGPPWCRSG